MAGRPRAYGLIMAAGAVAVAARTADRRHRDDVLLLALGVRRRGRRRARRSWSRPPDPRTRRVERGPRLDVVGAILVGRRSRARGLRRAALERVGLGAAEAGRPGHPRALADDRADPRRAPRALAVRDVGATAWSRHGREPLVAAGDVREPAVHRRPADVLLPVPDPGRAVLHHPAVPVGGAGPVRDRHRPADHAAVDHAAARRRRHPAVLPDTRPRAASSGRAALHVRRDRLPVPAMRRRRRRRRSSPSRCCWPASASARWRPSWAA